MKKHGKLDDNQPAIVKALREIGFSVQSLASVGDGCPDLLIGKGGINLLCEVKDPAKKPSARKLTPEEYRWHATWRGQCAVIERFQDVLNLFP